MPGINPFQSTYDELAARIEGHAGQQEQRAAWSRQSAEHYDGGATALRDVAARLRAGELVPSRALIIALNPDGYSLAGIVGGKRQTLAEQLEAALAPAPAATEPA